MEKYERIYRAYRKTNTTTKKNSKTNYKNKAQQMVPSWNPQRGVKSNRLQKLLTRPLYFFKNSTIPLKQNVHKMAEKQDSSLVTKRRVQEYLLKHRGTPCVTSQNKHESFENWIHREQTIEQSQRKWSRSSPYFLQRTHHQDYNTKAKNLWRWSWVFTLSCKTCKANNSLS